MKELNLSEINRVTGAGGEQIAQLAGTVAGTWLGGGNPYAGALGGYAAGEIYNGIQNGYQTAPNIDVGIGSYNANFNSDLGASGSFSVADVQAMGWCNFNMTYFSSSSGC
ncbi:TPA: hypothetical protein SMG11_001615 [Serratia marcescens]|jgi:hypothetical protein|uniref:hypothetical protein n=1 Tax=Serratia TaxID=613 RepID=UPI0006CB5AD2|nr:MULTISPECIES: hypothetical protein [Serratia]MDU3894882.1 hypothetical protein [Streptococcus salivarius]ALE95462.1 hypothetical protein ABH11_01105 [Serratia marcescens]AVN33077.1 hypothetical protein AM470_06765 [Serratia marcescens]AVN52068.1 hypothetical protein AM478_21000 [Serratia marcescens]EIM3523781.1 hypothetical protein [Serratia marcescens]